MTSETANELRTKLSKFDAIQAAITKIDDSLNDTISEISLSKFHAENKVIALSIDGTDVFNVRMKSLNADEIKQLRNWVVKIRQRLETTLNEL